MEKTQKEDAGAMMAELQEGLIADLKAVFRRWKEGGITDENKKEIYNDIENIIKEYGQ